MKIAIFLVPIILFNLIGYSQNKSFSVLEQEYAKAAIDQKPLILLNIAREYKNSDTAMNSKYIDSAIRMASKLQNKTPLVQLYNGLSYITYKQNNEYLLPFAYQALKLSYQYGFEDEIYESMNNIGSLYFNTGVSDSSIYYFEKASNYYKQKAQTNKYIEVTGLLITSLKKIGKFEKALNLGMELLATADKLEDNFLIANQLVDISNTYNYLKNKTLEKKYLIQALELYKKNGNTSEMARVYRFLSYIYLQEKDTEKALEYLDDALKIHETLGQLREISIVYDQKAYIYQSMKQYDEAVKLYERALEIGTKLNDSYAKIYILTKLGVVNINLKNYDKALDYLNKALDMCRPMNNLYSMCVVYKHISTIYLNKKLYALSEQNIQKSLDLAVSIQDVDLQKSALNFLSNLMYESNNYKKSVEYLRLFNQLNDSLNAVQINKQLTEMQTKYETEKKETEIKLLNTENEHKKALIARQQAIGIAIAGSLLLVIILAVVFFNGRRKQKKANNLLTIQNATISQQNEEIRAQNEEITSQKRIIETSHQHITASIAYASRIQQALLPQLEVINHRFPDNFVYFKPRDVVSGDFYWAHDFSKLFVVIAADCTGHGVPGAFMSLLGISILNEIVTQNNANKPSLILDELRNMLKMMLKQTGQKGEQQDGMDIAFCAINTETFELSFAGAHNSCWIFRKSSNLPDFKNLADFIELPADRMPVGIYTKEKPFTEQTFQLQTGDTFYIFSDGYHSQFGGVRNLPLKSKYFKELLSEIHSLPMQEQKQILENKFNEWRGENEQTDDVLVLGVRI